MTTTLNMPKSTYGLWKVTTEGDEEGRTIRHLGVFQGHFDEIALHCADKQYYALKLSFVEPQPTVLKPTLSEVNVKLDIGTGTWDLQGTDRSDAFNKWLKENGRTKVRVIEGQFYSSVRLIGASTEAEKKKLKDSIARDKALAKLNDKEKKLLGLKNE